MWNVFKIYLNAHHSNFFTYSKFYSYQWPENSIFLRSNKSVFSKKMSLTCITGILHRHFMNMQLDTG